MLISGTRIELEGDGSHVSVGRCLGEGGQGWVFEATADDGSELALKWYKTAPPGQREALAYLIERGAPSPQFLWPMGLAVSDEFPSFGYVMPLRPPDYLGLVSLLLGRDEHGEAVNPSFSAVVNLCFQLARSFLRLHANGLCYRDINYGNVFFRPDTGDVLVCDTDNVGVDGSFGLVLGAPGFMAPEVVLLLAGPDTPGAAYPSARSDLHSLAVTLFLCLMMAHPLEGAKTEAGLVDRTWQLHHFAADPVFIFDPADDRNRPTTEDPVRYWNAYPAFVRSLFTTAFTVGLSDPDARVREGVWAGAMLRLRDAIRVCSSCDGTIFHDADEPERPCVRCGVVPERPLFVAIGRHRIVLGPRCRVWSDHLGSDHDTTKPVGDVNAHPLDATRWGIRNLTDRAWTATTPDTHLHEVAPGRTIEVLPGTRIHFGPVEGVITR
jgi:DNA-binding helix-hairpin-helix protein with protein kinase domain